MARMRQLRAFVRPAMRAVRTLRLLMFPSQTRDLYALGVLGSSERDLDQFYFVNRKHYLSRFFDLRQRVQSVVSHYRHEQQHFDREYQALVYRTRSGLTLWEHWADGVRVSLRLCVSGDYRYEGDVSVGLYVDEQHIAFVSYSFVEAANFGLPSGATLFVTRVQITGGAAVAQFRACFRHCSPQYFCLAAIVGIAMANGLKSIAVIKAEAQVCYQPQLGEGFRYWYCDFWSQFGARSIDSQAYLLDVPLKLSPVQAVASKHRARAAVRRHHWEVITRQTEARIRSHRLHAGVTAGVSAAWLYLCECFCSGGVLAKFGELA